jgi:hypothetical protein
VEVEALPSLGFKVSLVLLEERFEFLESLRLPDPIATLLLGRFDLVTQLIKEFGAFILEKLPDILRLNLGDVSTALLVACICCVETALQLLCD